MSPRLGLLFAIPAVLLGAEASASEPDLRACVSAYEQGQTLPRQGELLRAREDLLVCARAPCPEPMWSDCLRWLDQVERATPSVVLAARDAAGRDLDDVRVLVDGRPLVDRVDARAIPVDPGEHTFRFQRVEGTAIDEHVLLRESERARMVTVQFGLPLRRAAVPVAPSPQGRPVAAYVLGGVGLLALGAFASLAIAGRADYFDAKSRCAPYCSSSDVEPARVKFIAADVSLGVSAVALGLATYLLVHRWANSGSPAARAERLRFDLRTNGESATAFLGGLF